MGRSFIIFSMARQFKLLFLLSLVVACLGDAVIPDRLETTTPPVVEPGTTPTPDPTTINSAAPSASTAPSVTAASSVSASPSVSAASSVSVDPSVSTTAPSSIVTDAKTSAPSLTTLNDPCASNPCGQGSTCEPRANQEVVCLCLPGAIYNNGGCQDAKVFPGDLTVPEIEYKPEMEDPRSVEFHDAALKITKPLDVVFKGKDGYSGSTVLRLEPGTLSSRVWSRQEKIPIKATVEISFSANAEVNTDGINDVIKNDVLCSTCPLKGGSFVNKALCNKDTCDVATTICNALDGSFTCNCLESYIPTSLSNRMCIACPSGQGVKDGKCVKCSFGLSGLNCSESWLRTLVIVASVLGTLLLITLIILPIVSLKSSKKSPKKNKNADIREPYVSPIPAKAPLVNDNFANSQAAPANRPANAFANAGVPRIPRATTTSGWDRTNLEMTPSNSRQNLVPGGRNPRLYDDDDDMAPYGQSRPQSSLYAQARPQSSLYAQARPQTNPYASSQGQANPYASSQGQANPYASSQGHTNPYYMQDDGRRFN